jgi:hypothetical protein
MAFSEIDEAASVAKYASTLQQPQYDAHREQLMEAAKLLVQAHNDLASRIFKKTTLLNDLHQQYPTELSRYRLIKEKGWFAKKGAVAIDRKSLEALRHTRTWNGIATHDPSFGDKFRKYTRAFTGDGLECRIGKDHNSLNIRTNVYLRNAMQCNNTRDEQCMPHKEAIFTIYRGVSQYDTYISSFGTDETFARQLAFDERYGIPIAREGLETLLAYDRCLDEALEGIRNF